VNILENDKLFDFMSKMYNEMQQGFSGLQKDMKEVKEDIVEVKKDIVLMKKDINSIYMKIDGDISNRLGAFEDGYKQTYEISIDLRDKVERITGNISDMNLTLTDMKEDINYIAGKAIRQDSKINKLSEALRAVK
jgi:chromosome segregation ATPase